MEAIGRVLYFILSRAKSVATTIKDVITPGRVIMLTISAPYILNSLQAVIEATRNVIVDVGQQLESWTQSTFWYIYNFIKSNVNLGPLTDPVAGLVAGIAMAYPYITVLMLKYVISNVAIFLANLALNAIAAVIYVYCRVVIPALKFTLGGYLLYRSLPLSLRWIAKSIDRSIRGSTLGAFGALAGALAPLTAFTLGYAVVSMLTDPACANITLPPAVNLGYAMPYSPLPPLSATLLPSYSSISALLAYYAQYGSYAIGYPYPALYELIESLTYIAPYVSLSTASLTSTSYVAPYVHYSLQQFTLLSYSYIAPYVSYVYGIPTLYSWVYPYVSYLLPTQSYSWVYPVISLPMLVTYIPEQAVFSLPVPNVTTSIEQAIIQPVVPNVYTSYEYAIFSPVVPNVYVSYEYAIFAPYQ